MVILVTGITGMLGHKMFQVIRARFPGTMGTAIEDVKKPPFDKVDFLQGNDVICNVDLADFEGLRRLLRDIRPDFVINCAGIVKQREQGNRAIPLITINALLPHKLAEIALEWGGKIIHPSTDCVFSGRRGAYGEHDQPDPEDLYGRSKLLGELQYENSLTLRTSIIGRELTEFKSLLEWLISQRDKTVRGFKGVIYSGVTTIELADVVTLILREYPGLHGLYQVVSKPISKYDLLIMLIRAFGLTVEIIPDLSVISDRSMIGDKLRLATGYRCPDWPELIQTLAQDPTPYQQWRSNPV